jgi:hypothetical protein
MTLILLDLFLCFVVGATVLDDERWDNGVLFVSSPSTSDMVGVFGGCRFRLLLPFLTGHLVFLPVLLSLIGVGRSCSDNNMVEGRCFLPDCKTWRSSCLTVSGDG